jgi:hypothetical protein
MPPPAYAGTTQTLTASAYGRQGCRAALINVSRVTDESGPRAYASYTVWGCAAGKVDPDQIIAQQSLAVGEAQFLVGQGGQAWSLSLSSPDGAVNLVWTPDGKVHTTYDATWTSQIVGKTPTKTTSSVTTDSAPPVGTLLGVPPEAVSGMVIRSVDSSR